MNADALQNVLCSTDIAILFLDPELKIRFFTPPTRALFSIIKSDVGRPLADLRSLASDDELEADAREVLRSHVAVKREVVSAAGHWSRRILPYRTHDGVVEGLIITLSDITEEKRLAEAVEAAKQEAERANLAQSQFLAAARHDLRQPLQTLAILHELLAKRVEGVDPEKLIDQLGRTLGSMSNILNTTIDINQGKEDPSQPQITEFSLDPMLGQLREEFADVAGAQKLKFRVVPCSLTVRSDTRLLKQMIRNLVSNALKYTRKGKVLLGCRRGVSTVSIEVWDTGVGISEEEIAAIFTQPRQPDSPVHDQSQDSDRGLAVAQRLGGLLGHRLVVRSWPGKGSVFTIETALSAVGGAASARLPRLAKDSAPAASARRTGRSASLTAPVPGRSFGPCNVYLIDDDRKIRDSVRSMLEDAGLIVWDFESAEAFRAARRQDGEGCLLIDGYLPGMDGIELLRLLRAAGDQIPAIIMTGRGDVPMAVEAMRTGAADFIEKPISGPDLRGRIQHTLEQSRDSSKQLEWQEEATQRLTRLTPRQRGIMDLVLSGMPSKNIAADLGISQRTVETHRAAIMRRTGAKSLPALARLAAAAMGSPA